jgi:alpha-2-macroglobulin
VRQIVRFFRTVVVAVWLGWSTAVQSIFGAWAWQAPPWARRLRLAARDVQKVWREHPRTAICVVLVAAVILTLGAMGWRWYQHRPQVDYISYLVKAPGRTPLELDNPKPEPLLVTFSNSAAALALAGKEIPRGITTSPVTPGTWRWLNDRELEFRVHDDWPIGQQIAVRMDKSLFGPQTRLQEDSFEFSTAPFSAAISGVELYQDPINPGVKNGVFDLTFSHPVDPAELEPLVELKLAGQKDGVLGIGRETTPFTITYDKLKLHASVHSATLPIPKDPSQIMMVLKPGTRALRGGNRIAAPLQSQVKIPGLYSLTTLNVDALVVRNNRDEPEQVLSVNLSAATGERDVGHAIKAWLLPKTRPAHNGVRASGSEDSPYQWYRPTDVTEADLAKAEALPLSAIPAEREYVETHSFKYHAEVGRFLFVQVQKNLRSFGGYLLAENNGFLVQVPRYPPQLSILSSGSILSLSGERKVVALVRELPGIQVSIGRLLPSQLQHLVSQSYGDYSNPQFQWSFNEDNLVERFRQKIPLTSLAHGQSHYEPIDLSPYLKAEGHERRGIFLLSVASYDPKAEERRRRTLALSKEQAKLPSAPSRYGGDEDSDEASQPTETYEEDTQARDAHDQRLVVVTDLGILMKRSIDDSQDVFVQSIASGAPVADAVVEIIARNGTSIARQTTDVEGRAHFASVGGLSRERAPMLVQVSKDSDLSFLPLNRADRSLDMSRFDVGGVRNARTGNEVHAYLFSDRGLYRPGDTIHVGMITKSADWSNSITGIPLQVEVLDARGLTVKREKLRLPASGFLELECPTADLAPAGIYTVNLYLSKDDYAAALIGSTTVRVQDFEPDRMKMNVHLSTENADGWVAPADLKANVNVQNLFGTPAENRRLEASLTLTPAFPAFARYPDYRFYDPQRAKDGYNDVLKPISTDLKGVASFELGLQKYVNATYRMHVLVRAFEPQGGRSVSADASAMVSEQPFLVGYKTDGALDYISRGSKRTVSLLAINPKANPTSVSGLNLVLVETQYVSVLTKQTNGTYKYESRKKDVTVSERALSIEASGAALSLETTSPGSFAYLIKNESGLELNRIEYAVAGAANVSRSLERNAELEIKLNKKSFAPGEEIELAIKAPYAGAGLITIERDHVYASRWFKSTTSASVQHIKLPADFEGNGYVNVQFVRDLGSDEIYTSPLSYGVAAFMTRLDSRSNELSLNVPSLVKPGTAVAIHLTAAHATRAVVFAVDEGILEVAHYQTPDPLNDFFKKRALEVRTTQILDLILPEFKRVLAAAAPGGDGEAALKRNLNPFKRKHAKPAVYWSGLVDVSREHDFTWTVPDSFNGSVKIYAVSVDMGSVGVAQAQTTVRADFVLTPNMPAAVSPGDEFDVSVGVANTVADSGSGAAIAITAELPPNLEMIGEARKVVNVDAMREGIVQFRMRARDALGSATINFVANWQNHSAKLADYVSVRPATPYSTEILAGYFGTSQTLTVTRELYPDYRKLKVGVSVLPLAIAGSLAEYLENYPHLCTEQLVSRGFQSLVLHHRPELAAANATALTPAERTAALVQVLRTRQNAEGGFGLWAATVDTDEFASVYAVDWLLQAREQGESIPDDLIQKGLVWLQTYAASGVADDSSAPGADGLAKFRNRAYAVYLLTRHGAITTPIGSSLRQSLEKRYANTWKLDVTAAYLAATYQIQKQESDAAKLIAPLQEQLGTASGRYYYAYYDDSVRDGTVLYILARHFPARTRDLNPHALELMVVPLSHGYYNTLSTARLLTALDTLASSDSARQLTQFSISEKAATGQEKPVPLSGELILQGNFSGAAKTLQLKNGTGNNAYYSMSSAGFDRTPVTTPLQEGLEINREYLNAKGEPVQSVKTGEEILVRLRMRAVSRDYVDNIAIIDLLPGGFEPVLNSAAQAGDAAETTEGNHHRWFNRLGSLGNWYPSYADIRDDRVVLYGSLDKNMAEYSYRIRATNAGTFNTAPSIAESMYDRQLMARTGAGRLQVVPPSP